MLREIVAKPTFKIQNKKCFNTQVSTNGFSWLSLDPCFKDVEHLEFLCAFVRPICLDSLSLLLAVGNKKGQGPEGQRIYSIELSIIMLMSGRVEPFLVRKKCSFQIPENIPL